MLYNDKKIGKKAWLLNGTVFNGLHLDDKTEYTIKAVKSAKESNDFCEHIILEDKDGKLIEVQEYNVIITPSNGIEQYLFDNDCSVAGVSNSSANKVAVTIEWGDWKHDHFWCADLMGYIGYEETKSKVTEEDGSDCYSAIHYFRKIGVK